MMSSVGVPGRDSLIKWGLGIRILIMNHGVGVSGRDSLIICSLVDFQEVPVGLVHEHEHAGASAWLCK